MYNIISKEIIDIISPLGKCFSVLMSNIYATKLSAIIRDEFVRSQCRYCWPAKKNTERKKIMSIEWKKKKKTEHSKDIVEINHFHDVISN